LKTNCRCSEI